MSGGMEDSRRMERSIEELEHAAYDLSEAIKRREWPVDVEVHVNALLEGSGFKLVRDRG